ncbi:right-handed parallel beta-helix repeat-containing protein [Euzebya tangerina]|uniref:right-handed parallel beta-helix repeat-containing protein n=1 Tax=Euzebya tangerina TaxID=591198 RepID=UPI000E316DC4|nr:right-handed parallel beta-helix repeat-containing protein [Euzebya tangerina]
MSSTRAVVIGAVVIGLGMAAVGYVLALLTGPEVPEGFLDGEYVRVTPEEDLAAIVAANPAGTTYLVGRGVHRGHTIAPKDGDTIVGEPGAVLSGAVELTTEDFSETDEGWVSGERTEEPFFHGPTYDGFERHAAQHELWGGVERLEHVATRAEVDEPGEWFFDYDADEILMFDPPSRYLGLELSVLDDGIRSEAADVTIRDLTVTRYATRAQIGAIQADGPGWDLSNLTVTDNHGVGVRLGDGAQLRDSLVSNNGQMGVRGERGSGMRVENTEIAYNASLQFEWFWEASGTKFLYVRDFTFINNWVHHNGGPGIWFDIDTYDSAVIGNLAEHNEVMGMFIEASFGAEITSNTFRNNGFGPNAGRLGAGLSVSAVSDAVVTDNRFEDNAIEFSGIHYRRESEETGETYTIEGLVFSDNHVEANSEGAVAFYVDTGEDELYDSDQITFTDNTYVLGDCEQCFQWGELIDTRGWLALGNDSEAAIQQASG